MFAQVIVDIAHAEVDKIFEYSCDESVQVGCRVKVPFAGRQLDGFVVGLSQTSSFDPKKIKPVLYAFDEPPALLPECLRLVESLCFRYRVPKAVALRLFLPTEMRLGKVSALYRRVAIFAQDVEVSSRAAQQQKALAYLKQVGEADMAYLNQTYGSSAMKALMQKGAFTVELRQQNRKPMTGVEGELPTARTLTDDQQTALAAIKNNPQTVQLLHGVTGSGKTEIYLNAIADQVRQGKTAIFLVPEISLTPQMLSQLRARFLDQVAILHSGLSAGERFDEWWRLRSGQAKIAVGARSAIFAPLSNLGIIVMDEEHDSSYLSESSPRYSTVEVAQMRAKQNGCKLILGSATPSVESFVKAKSGEYGLITLTKRINQKPMPVISIADMRKEVKRGNDSPLSRELKEELEQTLADQKQAILFLNRRGYSQTVVCRDCGYVAKCEHCDVTLTYHSEDRCLKCHYCGTKYHMLSACPDCGGKHIYYSGTGTQKVVAELKELFPTARILRMDNDTVSGKDGHYKILKQFGEHQADILVGTQMIAKGHDFPSVTLVGILDADMSLHFSDYRSGERTFQLITQVAGRSGRAGEQGKVVLQTYSPENYILRYAVNYDYLGFFQSEVNLRQATGFPPYSLICRVMVTGESDEKCVEALRSVYFAVEDLSKRYPDEFIFLNKMHAPIKKIQGKVRYQVLMRLQSGKYLPQIYDIAVQNSNQSVLVYVEENPVNLS